MTSFLETFKHVYFRIEAGYAQSEGYSGEQQDKFNADVKDILLNLGFTVEREADNEAYLTVKKGKESLRCHPMNLSGYLFDNTIKAVETVLVGSDVIKLLATDIIGVAYDMDATTFYNKISEYRDTFRQVIFTLFTTNQSTKYYSEHRLVNFTLRCPGDVRDKFSFIQDSPLSTKLNYHLIELMNEMVEEGLLVENTQCNQTCYRSLNNSEEKKLQREHPEVSVPKS